MLDDSAVAFVPFSTGHPISSQTAKNDVPSSHCLAVHSAVADKLMHSGIHSMNKGEVSSKMTKGLILLGGCMVDSTHHFFVN